MTAEKLGYFEAGLVALHFLFFVQGCNHVDLAPLAAQNAAST
jgi:hypothetical protein